MHEMQAYIRMKREGKEPSLPSTADVFMYPGSSDGKDGWWLAEAMWMQAELAMDIFEHVFGKPGASRFRFVANVDWSQNHAATADDALDAEKMLVNTGGKTAKHIRVTHYPWREGQPPRSLICNKTGCLQCENYLVPFMTDSSLQTIGVKGLKMVRRERGLPPGKNQADNVSALQRCEDFSPKFKHDKAYLNEMMKARGHVCLFGVKFHAELAHIERFWMWLKQKIRGRLTGKLAKLRTEIWKEYGTYTVLDSRKAARHCRETMEAYRRLAEHNDLGLDDLDTEQKKVYSTHRRVFESNTAALMVAADMPVTDVAASRAQISATRKANGDIRDMLKSANAKETEALLRRRKRAKRTDEEVEREKVRCKTAKAHMQQRRGE